MNNIKRKMINTTDKHFQQQSARRFPNSNNFDLSKTINVCCPITLLHEQNKKDLNTETFEELRVQNYVIRLSIDLLDLCHKGSVTVNRHDIFLFLKIEPPHK